MKKRIILPLILLFAITAASYSLFAQLNQHVNNGVWIKVGGTVVGCGFQGGACHYHLPT